MCEPAKTANEHAQETNSGGGAFSETVTTLSAPLRTWRSCMVPFGVPLHANVAVGIRVPGEFATLKFGVPSTVVGAALG